MTAKPLSISRFRSAYTRQIALWILRAFASGAARRKFFSRSGFGDADVVEYLGLPEDESKPGPVGSILDGLRLGLESTEQPVGLPPRARRNLERFADSLSLNPAERCVLAFFVCLKTDPILENAWSLLEDLPQRNPGRFLSRVLGLTDAAVNRALDQEGTLRRCRILEKSDRCRREEQFSFASEAVAAHLLTERYDSVKILKEFRIRPAPPPEMELGSYDHLGEPLGLLLGYLSRAVAERRRGVNLLLHGVPGTGKTQLARVLGKALALPVYEIETSLGAGRKFGAAEQFGAAERLESLDFADMTLSSRPALLVFDEAEDVFSSSILARSVAETHKGWFNAMLERNHWPAIWISNRIHGLDPAFVRRFDMVLEIPVPPRSERHRLVAETVGDLAGAELAERIAGTKTIAPAVLARAAKVVRTAGGALPLPKREAALVRLLGDTLKAQGHPDPFQSASPFAACGSYDPAFLNTQCDLAEITRRLRTVEGARLCLHGPPGTGKTAFGHWLAAELDRPLLTKRASELLGPYVGQTEVLIGEAFEEAVRDGAILLLDEIDSFLANREYARRSWEITCVNEMLTRIESFPGILVASTNRLEALDPASLRRFDLKVPFDYLRGDQVESLLAAQCRHLGLGAPGSTVRARAKRLATCTPGDFAAVARRHRFAPCAGPGELLEAVAGEIVHRTALRPAIGFA